MRTAPEDLERPVLSLPAGDRARLAKRLIESLDQDPEVELAWEKEIAQRVAQIESGEATPISADEVFSEARRLIGAS